MKIKTAVGGKDIVDLEMTANVYEETASSL
jgi:hypothetical protein